MNLNVGNSTPSGAVLNSANFSNAGNRLVLALQNASGGR
jgi:hypothetical protein